MFGFLPQLAVRRPVFTTMMVALCVVMGGYSFTRLQTDLFPDVEFPFISVATVYPGASPEEVETQVTDRIEEAISTLAGIEDLRSFSQQNLSIVIVQFALDVDQDQAAIDVRDRVETVRAEMPSAVEPPVVSKFDFTSLPIMELALSGPQGVDALYELADDELRDRLSRVTGVAAVQIVGGREREVEVLVDGDRLRGYGLTLNDVVQLIGAENVSVPAGRITEPRVDVPVRVVGEYRSVVEIEDLRLLLPGGGVARLADVATVRDGFGDLTQVARFNRAPAVSLGIQKRSDANTVTTAAGIREEVDAITAALPPGASLTVVRDGSEFIRDSINDVLSNLLIGILLTTAVLFGFLHSWRGTLIAALAMPITVVATFLLVDAAGFTLNVMTLMALGITVGILVTNTIVVLENIYRHLDAGDTPAGAAATGTTEVAVAVVASTLTNVVVFTPIAFMGGIIGQFFYAFGLTVVFATVFSIFMSFTLAPLLAARLLRTGETEEVEHGRLLGRVWRLWDRAYETSESSYRHALAWALARPRNGWFVIVLILSLSFGVMALTAGHVGGEFLPRANETGIKITIDLPPGTPIERTSAVAAIAEERLAALDDVESILMTVSSGGDTILTVGGGTNRAELLVVLRDGSRRADEVIRDVRPMLADLPDTTLLIVAIDPGDVGGGQAPIQLLISGPDSSLLRDLGGEVARRLASVPALSDVDYTVEDPRPELVFRPDRAAIADHGLTVGAIGQLVRTSIEGTVAGVFRGEAGKERDIRIRLVEDARARTAQVAGLDVRSRKGVVPLAGLGTLEQRLTPTSIQRVDRVRSVQINAQIGAGSLTDAVAALEAVMADVPLAPGYTWRVTGDFEEFGKAAASVLVALFLAITLTYIVLAMILESFVHPFTVMLTLPLGAVGATLALFLTAATMNIFSMMAIIMLVGIVVNNAILILDYTAILRARGLGVVEALLDAAPTRLRPIGMTSIAIVFALIPQAVGTGAGAAFRMPMAVVTMGGVVLSAVFTLFLIPVIYTKLDRIASWRADRRA
ncbi:MAG: efflux RND transporter permease subunit [Acidobacteria bacterium]|nr:efflux RND transporter permease subunit [Acidobacteriota bacterium]